MVSLLHQCDNCKRTQPNELPITVVEMRMQTFSDPSNLEFCSWKCVREYADKRLKG